MFLGGTSCTPFLSGHDYTAVRFSPTGFELWRNSWDNAGADDVVDDVCFDGVNRFGFTGAAGMQAGTVVMIDPGVTPHTVDLVQGLNFGGGLDHILLQDNLRMRMIPGTSQAVSLELTGTVPLDAVDELRVRLGANTNSLAIVQRIELFDHTSSAFVQVDVRPGTQADTPFEVVVPQQQRFIEPGTGKIQARVTWTAPTGNRLDSRWFIDCNSFQWKIKRAALE